MIKAMPPVLEYYKLAYLTEDEEPQVEMLLERCADYLDLVAGLPPSLALAHDLFTTVPEGKGYEGKILLDIWAESAKLVGLLDAVRNYPAQGVWFLGLLLLEPGQRKHGTGAQIYRRVGKKETLRPKEFEAIVDTYAQPGAVRGSIAWYRAGAGSGQMALSYSQNQPSPIIQPTAVVWGEADPILLSSWADRLEEYFYHLVRVQMLAGIGHFTPFEAPDAIAEAIKAVL
jgi:pimeloyl-ACP methyl ester carboxylesterase